MENLIEEKNILKYMCQIYENKNLKKDEVINKTLVVEFYKNYIELRASTMRSL